MLPRQVGVGDRGDAIAVLEGDGIEVNAVHVPSATPVELAPLVASRIVQVPSPTTTVAVKR